MSVVDALRQNDPATKKIRIRLRDETSAADLAQALELNTFVTLIDVDFERVQLADWGDWGDFLRVIATRDNLETVKLRDAFTAEDRSAPPALVSAFLRSIRQNSAIRTVFLICLRLPTEISTFVDTASSITKFVLLNCDMEQVEREQGARDLAEALRRNTNIKNLELVFMDDIYAIPILQSLQANVSLKTIGLGRHAISAAVSHAIQQLFESNTSIQTFELTCTDFGGENFHLLTQAIIGSNCVSELKFVLCQFGDEESSTAQFRSILQNKRNLTGLCLRSLRL